MGVYVNRTTQEVDYRGSPTQNPAGSWLLVSDPGDRDLVRTNKPSHREIVAERPVLKSQAERDAADAAEAAAAADAGSAQADAEIGLSNDAIPQEIRQVLREMNQDHNKLAHRVRECERAFNDVKNTSGGSDNIRAAIPLPSAEVISEGVAPATFTNLQDRAVSTFTADYRQNLLDRTAQV